MTRAEFEAEGERRFGPDKKKWKFICPVCGHIASVQDWLDAGVEEQMAFSCIGRSDAPAMQLAREAFASTGKGPCNYAGGGLFKLNPLEIEGCKDKFFAFAPASEVTPG